MSICCICQKTLGVFNRVPLYIDSADKMSYWVCAECSSKISLLKANDPIVVNEFKTTMHSINDVKLKEYLVDLYENPDLEELERLRQIELGQERQIKIQKLISEKEDFIMLTTGYNFYDYKITEYKGVISGECVLGTGWLSELGVSLADTTGTQSRLFSEKLKYARDKALFELKKECCFVDGNAVIGLQFNYTTFAKNIIGVIANGTAVVIERLNL